MWVRKGGRKGERKSWRMAGAAGSAQEWVRRSVMPNGLAIITLDRPKALNAMNVDMTALYKKYMDEWSTNNKVHAVLVESSSPRAFSAGMVFFPSSNSTFRFSWSLINGDLFTDWSAGHLSPILHTEFWISETLRCNVNGRMNSCQSLKSLHNFAHYDIVVLIPWVSKDSHLLLLLD